MKAEETRKVATLTDELARNADGAVAGAEADVTTRRRTNAELERGNGLMEVVCERGNLMPAYQRVVENKGAAGVDSIGVAEFKDHLKQHWPTIKAKLLAGDYMPLPARRVDTPKPQSGVRTLGIPTLTDHMIQQALHQVMSHPATRYWRSQPLAGAGPKSFWPGTRMRRPFPPRMLRNAMSWPPPIFEAEFSESSYGFRPGRNAHQAVKAAKQYVTEDRRIVKVGAREIQVAE